MAAVACCGGRERETSANGKMRNSLKGPAPLHTLTVNNVDLDGDREELADLVRELHYKESLRNPLSSTTVITQLFNLYIAP